MIKKDKSYNDIRDSLKKVREAKTVVNTITEADTQKTGGVPYTDQDELYKFTIESTRQQFGADYSKSKTPMLYDPKDGDVTLSGIIPSLGNAPFHYRYSEENGCYVWLNGLSLTDDVLTKLNRVLGVYKNWRKEIEQSGDRKPISYQSQNQ